MLIFEDRSRPHRYTTAILWAGSVIATLVSGGVASLMVIMPMSLDWGETIAAGSEPWANALIAAGEFVAIAVTSALGMALWHTHRYKGLALVLVSASGLATVWLGLRFVGDYT